MTENEARLERKRRRQRFVYGFNTVMCFSAGPLMALAPGFARKVLKWPYDDPVMMGIYGSVVTSVGALSAAALHGSEEKYDHYLPILYAQMLYKAFSCLLIARKLLRKEASSRGMHFILWFFMLYVALLAGSVPWRGGAEAAGDRS